MDEYTSQNSDYASVIDLALSKQQTLRPMRVSKPELSRKDLHIRLEQRRRERITDGFSQLKAVVPTVREGVDSKAVVLRKSAEYIEALEYEVGVLKSRLVVLENMFQKKGHGTEQYTPLSPDQSLSRVAIESVEKDGDRPGNSKTDSGVQKSSEIPQHNLEPVNMAPRPPIVPYNVAAPPYGVMPYPLPPIIGTPIRSPSVPGMNTPEGYHNTLPIPAALMQPTVPYYFASDFVEKRKKELEKKGKIKDDEMAYAVTVASKMNEGEEKASKKIKK